jgi:hypothetical protein
VLEYWECILRIGGSNIAKSLLDCVFSFTTFSFAPSRANLLERLTRNATHFIGSHLPYFVSVFPQCIEGVMLQLEQTALFAPLETSTLALEALGCAAVHLPSQRQRVEKFLSSIIADRGGDEALAAAAQPLLLLCRTCDAKVAAVFLGGSTVK